MRPVRSGFLYRCFYSAPTVASGGGVCNHGTIKLSEEIQYSTMREIRYLDKLVDELANEKAMAQIVRTSLSLAK